MRTHTTLALILGVLVVPVPSRAETQVSGEVDMGYQKRDVSSNEANFEKYGEVPDGAVVPDVSLDVRTTSATIHFDGHDIQQNTQSYNLNYNRNYKLKVDASWDQIPHLYSNTAQTLYTEVKPGIFKLPDQIQSVIQSTSSARQTPLLADYWGAAHPVQLGIQDNKGAVNFAFAANENMKFKMGFSEDKIEGAKPWGGAFSTSLLTQLPAPVDYRVYNMTAGSQYNTKDVQFGFSYLGSSFKNKNDTLIWDNSRQLADGTLSAAGASTPGQGRESLAPNNWSHTFSLNAGANLPAKTRLNATGIMGYMSQNEDLLPYTINSKILTTVANTGAPNANLVSSLPEQSANAKIMTWTQDYALTNRLVKPVTLGVHYHSYQLVNRTSDVTFAGQSPADAAWEADPGSNNHFEYRKDLLEGSFDYQVINPLMVAVKYGTEWTTRNDREVHDSTEKILTVNSDFTPARWTLLRGTYIHAHRRPQNFDSTAELEEAGTGLTQLVAQDLPGLRRYDVADRLRNQGKVLWQITPNGPVNITLNGSMTHDNFQPGIGSLNGGINSVVLSSAATPTATQYTVANQNQMYGLLENRDTSAGVDVGLDVTQRLAFDLYYDYEESRALQRSNDNNVGVPATSPTGTAPTAVQDPATDWTLREVDRYHTAGISARINRPNDPVSFRLAYDVVISRGANDFLVSQVVENPILASTTGTIGVVTPADTKYMKQDISLRTNIRMSDHWSVGLGYVYEKYDVSNWQQQGIPLVPTNTNGPIYLGTNLQNYVAHIGSVIAKYKF